MPQCTSLAAIDTTHLKALETVGNEFLRLGIKLTSVNLGGLVGLKSARDHFLYQCASLETIDTSPLRVSSLLHHAHIRQPRCAAVGSAGAAEDVCRDGVLFLRAARVVGVGAEAAALRVEAPVGAPAHEAQRQVVAWPGQRWVQQLQRPHNGAGCRPSDARASGDVRGSPGRHREAHAQHGVT